MSTIVNCVAYRHGKKTESFNIDDISEIIRQEDVFVWIGLHEPDHAMLQKIQEEFGLHELAMEDARSPHQRPKLEIYGEHLFMVAKTAILKDNKVVFGETHIFVGKQFLITLRHGASTTYAPARTRCENDPQRLALGASYGLYAVLDQIVDDYLTVINELRNRFNSLEASMFSEKISRRKLEKLYIIKRELMQLRDATQPLIDMGNELMRFHEDIIPKSVRVYLRDVHDHCLRVIDTCDHISEMLMAAMQINLALVSIGQNDIVKQLAGWGAILALPTVVFSMYGMNFVHMPELDGKYSYFLVVAGTTLGGAWLHRKLKRSGWL